MPTIYRVFILTFVLAVSVHSNAKAADNFSSWVDAQLSKAGLNDDYKQTVKGQIQFLPRVIELDQKQPEKKISFASYKKRILSTQRINKGRKLYTKHAALLNEIGEKYNVQPKYIVALWGIETSYGGFTGGTKVLSALATLAYQGRRAEFFTEQFHQALRIANDMNMSPSDMKGSWAGAMGQCQFMPSSYQAYAIDYNGDGRKDIWHDLEDVFASMANYLATVGWQGDLRWGRSVKLPDDFSLGLEGRKVIKPISEWQKLGVRLKSGHDLPYASGIDASIIIPDKDGSDAYIVYSNYHTLMHWNRSTYFATSVGLLADQIAVK